MGARAFPVDVASVWRANNININISSISTVTQFYVSATHLLPSLHENEWTLIHHCSYSLFLFLQHNHHDGLGGTAARIVLILLGRYHQPQPYHHHTNTLTKKTFLHHQTNEPLQSTTTDCSARSALGRGTIPPQRVRPSLATVFHRRHGLDRLHTQRCVCQSS